MAFARSFIEPADAGRRLHSRAISLALILSVVLHLIGFEQIGGLAREAPVSLAFPIAARLEDPPPAPSSPPRPAPPSSTRPAAPPLFGETPIAPAQAPAVSEDAPRLDEPIEPLQAVAAAEEPQPTQPQVEAHPAPVAAERPVRRQLPSSLSLSYAIQTSADGFTAGRAEYRWQSRNGRYSLLSTTQAVGVVALFMSGRIVQVSAGRLDETGLRPDQFWIRRNENRQESARFDWAGARLHLGEGRGEFDLPPQAQDLLSFAFHLALTADPDEREFDLWVTNGRRFKDYRFRNLGPARVEVAGHKRDTLHLRGSRPGEGQLDVWLDLDLGGLPLKIATVDNKERTFVLLAESLPMAE